MVNEQFQIRDLKSEIQQVGRIEELQMSVTTTNQLHFEALKANDHIKVTRRMKVGLKIWYTSTSGRVIRTDRRRNGLHVDRNQDDKAFQDIILMWKDGNPPEETTIAMDEFTVLEKLSD